MWRAGLSAVFLTTLAACTQPAVQVDMRGEQRFSQDSAQQSYGNQHNRSNSITQPPKHRDGYKPYEPAPIYTNTKPVPEHTQQAASLESVSSSDLPPPSKSESARVNPWKPNDDSKEDERSAAESKSIFAEVRKKEKPASEQSVKLIKPNRGTSYMWPVSSHKVISSFGPKGAGKSNDGINIASAEGEPVWAAADGEVVYVDNELKSYGNMVILKHAKDKSTSYAHLSKATVDKYDRVKQGDIIGYVGTTGNVKKPQLHFAVRSGKDPVDPKKYVSTSVAGL